MIKSFSIKYNKFVWAWRITIVDTGTDKPIKIDIDFQERDLGNIYGYSRERPEYIVLKSLFEYTKATLIANNIDWKEWYEENYDSIDEIYIITRDWVAEPKNVKKEFRIYDSKCKN